VLWLAGFKNRLAVLANGVVAFLGRGRPQRVISAQQVFAREPLEAQPTATTVRPRRRTSLTFRSTLKRRTARRLRRRA